MTEFGDIWIKAVELKPELSIGKHLGLQKYLMIWLRVSQVKTHQPLSNCWI